MSFFIFSDVKHKLPYSYIITLTLWIWMFHTSKGRKYISQSCTHSFFFYILCYKILSTYIAIHIFFKVQCCKFFIPCNGFVQLGKVGVGKA